MKFEPRLQPAVFLRRRKRFLVDALMPDGTQVTAHCPNTGSMAGCGTQGDPVCLSWSDNPKRKYALTLEMVRVGGVWVGIHTGRTNALVLEAVRAGFFQELGPVDEIATEVRVGTGTRLDLAIRRPSGTLFVEVKNCTLVDNGVALFPDAVTERGLKHLRDLMRLKRQGHGAAVIFCVQRMDATRFRPAARIDPAYAEALGEAAGAGVLVLACQAQVEPEGIVVVRRLPVQLDPGLNTEQALVENAD